MSESNNASDTDSDRSPTPSFNMPGIWDDDIAEGPALALPAEYADLRVGDNLFIEFLLIDSGKNHVVLRVPFERPIRKDEQDNYYGVRIAMDIADLAFVVLDDSEDGAFYDDEKKAGIDYWPGQFNAKLLKFDGPSNTAQRMLCFTFLEKDLTVGALINVATDANMHKFVFLLYPGVTVFRWKGCRDFVLQYWLLLIKKGIIAATTLEGDRLTDHIAFNYDKDLIFPELVHKGDFIRFSRDETEAHVQAVYAT